MDDGTATYSDGTTGDAVDIPGWIGADIQGWIDNGGTYDRDTNFPNRQGSVAAQIVTRDGLYYSLSSGGGILFRFDTEREQPFPLRTATPNTTSEPTHVPLRLPKKKLKAYTMGGYHDEHPDNEDLRWVQRSVWGRLGYKE